MDKQAEISYYSLNNNSGEDEKGSHVEALAEIFVLYEKGGYLTSEWKEFFNLYSKENGVILE